MKIYRLLIILWISGMLYGRGEEDGTEAKKPPAVGNLSLPTSQQPGPLFTFGQTVVEKGDLVFYTYTILTRGDNRKFSEILPLLIYGYSDATSFLFAIPCEVSLQEEGFHSSGIGDIVLQCEHAYYAHPTDTGWYNASFVASISIPSGSIKKNPPTGAGSPQVLMGGTFTYLGSDWHLWATQFFIVAAKNCGIKPGNQYLYQGGIGHYIPSPPGWIYNIMVEFIGNVAGKTTVDHVAQPNTGGHTFFVAPSLWISSEKWTFQAGCAFPVTQELNGIQNKTNYVFVAGLGYKFN